MTVGWSGPNLVSKEPTDRGINGHAKDELNDRPCSAEVRAMKNHPVAPEHGVYLSTFQAARASTSPLSIHDSPGHSEIG
jgi:hypothetical protein